MDDAEVLDFILFFLSYDIEIEFVKKNDIEIEINNT
jgi:hypothetical protein